MRGSDDVYHEKTYSSPYVSARLWRNTRLAVSRVDAACTNASAPDGSKLRETLCRYMAPAWCGAGVLESSAGRLQLRIFVYHETIGAIPRSRGAHHRT